MNASVGGKSRRAAGRVFGALAAVVLLSVSLAVLLSVPAVNAQGESFTDTRDGKTYRTVQIGDQTWMAENLNYKTDSSTCYGNKERNCRKYGRLYDWDDAMKACPAGWHLPSNDEWWVLTDFVGGREVAGTKLKSKTGWSKGQYYKAATDDYGFSALPGGYRIPDGIFHYVINISGFYDAGSYGRWWSATEGGATFARYWDMSYSYEGVSWNYYDKAFQFSLRCVEDKAVQR
ncbi:MAG: fibrobacter succinogenes major paralogous domain-containing protein [Chitinispirillia bacterium]|nr:fibrobacter succinogenes major paralogous domain-containing protein [Chitinispirillia bacterium]MCL2241690.1 fibrobacter succinogenes major paralogous domain-containing protein [Chitinispirillia bacterium]